MADSFDGNQWTIAASSHVWWHRISIRGRADVTTDYTTSIFIAYIVDGIVWTPYKESKASCAN